MRWQRYITAGTLEINEQIKRKKMDNKEKIKSVAIWCHGLNNMRDFCHGEAVARGFYDEPKETGTQIMLVVSELAEAMEADRNERYADYAMYNGEDCTPEAFKKYVKDSFEDEIADAMIRLFDLCGAMKIDIATHVYEKLKYNMERPYKHGKKY